MWKRCCSANRERASQGQGMSRAGSGSRIFIPVFGRRHPRYLFKNITEGFYIRIAHLVHHLLDRFPSDLQLFFGSFYFHPLYIFNHGVAGSFFEPAFECPAADIEVIRDLVYSQVLRIVPLDELLGFDNWLVLVIFLTVKNYKGGLVFTVHV